MPRAGQPNTNPAPAPGPGRPKGSQNKLTVALKEIILTALDGAHRNGSVGYLKLQAKKNPTAFLALVGRLVPNEIRAEMTGLNGGPIAFSALERANRVASLLKTAGARRARSTAKRGTVGAAAGAANSGVREPG